MHDGKHHDSSGQVVKIGRNTNVTTESVQIIRLLLRVRSNWRIKSKQPLLLRISTIVIVANRNKTILGALPDIWQEDKTGNKALDCCAGFWDGRSLTVQIARKIISMLTGYEMPYQNKYTKPIPPYQQKWPRQDGFTLVIFSVAIRKTSQQ